MSPLKTERGSSTIVWWGLGRVAFSYVIMFLPLSKAPRGSNCRKRHVTCRSAGAGKGSRLGGLSHHILKGRSPRGQSQWLASSERFIALCLYHHSDEHLRSAFYLKKKFFFL